MPIDGIVGVLEKVRAACGDKAIGHFGFTLQGKGKRAKGRGRAKGRREKGRAKVRTKDEGRRTKDRRVRSFCDVGG
jgi:hypothetical protein